MPERDHIDGWKLHFGQEFSHNLAESHFGFPLPKEDQRAVYFSEVSGGDGESITTDTVACLHINRETGLRKAKYAVIGAGAVYPYSRWITLYDYHDLVYEVPEIGFKKEGMVAVTMGTYQSDKLWRKRKLESILVETGKLFESEEFQNLWRSVKPVQTLELIEQSQYYQVSPGKWVEGDRSMMIGHNPITYTRNYFAAPEVPLSLYNIPESNPAYGKMRDTIPPRIIEADKQTPKLR